MMSSRTKPAHDQAGDEEALPEVEGGAALAGGALVGAEGGELAAAEEDRPEDDPHGGQSAPWVLGAASWGFVVSGRALVSDGSTAPTLSNPAKKLEFGAPVPPPLQRQCACGWP